MGFRALMTSAETGINIAHLKELLRDKQTALAGQSGVGKSSLLNAIQPGLGLAVSKVSQENNKGRHTTTAAQLIPAAHRRTSFMPWRTGRDVVAPVRRAPGAEGGELACAPRTLGDTTG